jgi:putative SOS response-associated peptidase YedK
VPNIGDHTLFSIMTTEPNAIVEPIHEKAMPVMLMTPEDVEQWLQTPMLSRDRSTTSV